MAKKCPYEMSSNNVCERPGYKDDMNGYCIFHSENVEGKKKEFKVEFKNEFINQLKSSSDYINFEGFVFPDRTPFYDYNIEKQISFFNAKFHGPLIIMRYEFHKSVDFRLAKFYDGVYFEKIIFKNLVNFRDAYFQEKTNFNTVTFEGDTHFNKSNLNTEINFENVTFEKMTVFNNSHFKKTSIFEKVNFMGNETLFTETVFEKDANFLDAKFTGKADFVSVEFLERANFHKSKFSGEAYFSKATFSGEADFSNATFEGETKFNNIECLESITFMRSKFYGVNFNLKQYYKNKELFFKRFEISKEIWEEIALLTPKELKKNKEKLCLSNEFLKVFFSLGLPSSNANFSISKFKNNINFNEAEFGISKILLDQIREFPSDKIKEIKKSLGLSQKFITNIKNLKPHRINIGNAIFSGIEVYGKAIFNDIKIYLKKADFREAKFYKRLEFKVEHKYINKVSMIETYIYDLMGDEGRLGGTRDKNGLKRGLIEALDQKYKDQKYFKKRWPFFNLSEVKRRLKINKKVPFIKKYKFKLYKYLSEEFTPILGEHAEARYPIAARDIKDDRFLMRFKERHPYWFFIWWLFANCGRSFKRWAFWCLFFIFIFAWLFSGPEVLKILPDTWQEFFTDLAPAKFENTSEAYKGFKPGFWSLIYFSIVTFTTLGFGDIIAANATARVLVTIEVILGYIMLGGLISILATKLARRS